MLVLREIERATEHCRAALLSFAVPGGAGFWRDAVAKRAATAKPPTIPVFFATSTFIAVAALLKLGQMHPSLPYSGEPVFDVVEFVKGLAKKGLPAVFAESAITQSVPDGKTNIYTMATCLSALCHAYDATTGRAKCTVGLKKDFKTCGPDEDPAKTIAGLALECVTLITEHVRKEHGGALEPGNPHPFLTWQALTALDHAHRMGVAPLVDDATRQDIEKRSRTETERILADETLGRASPADVVALAFHARLLGGSIHGHHRQLGRLAADVVLRLQEPSGDWPLGRSLHDAPHGVQIPSLSIAVALLETELDRFRRGLPGSESEQPAYARVFVRLTRSFWDSETDGLRGWCSDRRYLQLNVEAWTTAYALDFLTLLREYAQRLRQAEVAPKYDVAWPQEMSNWRDWERLAEPSTDAPVLAYIGKFFIDPILDPSGETVISLPHQDNENVSMILFGPPGTAKTSIAKALAKKLNWPLITITPSVFMKEGIGALDRRASEVFQDLLTLQKVVVLFDECDELFHKRSGDKDAQNEGTANAGLVTGAMLPRLQDLHDRGQLIFILATNRLGMLDPAVKRPGRFDHLVGIGLPGKTAREKYVSDAGPELATEMQNALAEGTEGLTIKEVFLAVRLAREALTEKPTLKASELQSAVLKKWFPDAAREISSANLRDAEEQMNDHCAVRRAAKRK